MESEQLVLADAPPSPWEEVRAANPNDILVRVIDAEHRLQFWIQIQRNEHTVDAEIHDGATILLPRVPRPGRTDEERTTLVAAYDTAWHKSKKNQCPSTSPTSGAKA